jgi:hypothetical protein
LRSDGTVLEIAVDDVDPDTLAVGQRRDQGAEGLGGAAGAADHATEVVRVDVHLEDVTSRGVLLHDLHLVRVIDDPPDEVFECRCEH